ncbi:MAG: EAL domain-containing protein [Azoarcus sp.]|jgi:EAL domain-containing protein (putative c-di-GMP-specific phosphodiesterase class I)/GGDEF domain-containing protein|nr:EAL domain-containing protein [Azoarcus sp.]
MSLIKQLWIAITAITLLALGGSLAVSTHTARQYLEQQLEIKNSDNANVLALAIGFLLKDAKNKPHEDKTHENEAKEELRKDLERFASNTPESKIMAGCKKDDQNVALENKTHENKANRELREKLESIVFTMLESQFATGYYRRILLVDPEDDRIIADCQTSDSGIAGVPNWFVDLADIEERPGVALVDKGWYQFGKLTVESHSRYVYQALWKNTKQLLMWFLATAAIAGLLGSLLLSRITAPLRTLVSHAQAIGERRFITTPEPRTAELKVVVRAMNALSDRVRQMLADEAQRLENLRRQLHEDTVTGLLERRQFMNAFSTRLADSGAPAQGALLILRVGKLNELNRDLGRTATDKLLNALAQALGGGSSSIGGRLNGSDLALLAPTDADFEFSPWAATVAARIHAVANEHANASMLALAIAAIPYSRNDAIATILSRIDTALAQAELEGVRGLKIEDLQDDARPARTQEQWRTLLVNALEKNELQPSLYPVHTLQGQAIHNEMTFDLSTDGTLLKTGDFLPWATRLGLISRIDFAAVQIALARIRKGEKAIAVTILGHSLQDGRFVTELMTLLRANPDEVEHLWMEVPEESAALNSDAFHAFCLAIKPFASKVGIKHAGPRFSALGDLHDLGLDYLKVDTSLLRDIDQNKDNQSIVRSLAMLAHTLGFIVIAEGVDRPEQQAVLANLGFDGLAGPLLASK